MISQIASVFSSQGVVLQGTDRVAVPRDEEDAPQPIQVPERVDFGALFDQAATRLELSSRAVKAAEETASGRDALEAWARAMETAPGGRRLSEAERERVEELKERDREVRDHEERHAAAAGPYAVGGPKYEYQGGPDGKKYAVGGSVDVDTSPVRGNPEATLEKARVLQRAALAPAEPSGADRSVAAQAARMAQDAARQLAEERRAGEGTARGGRPDPYARRAAPAGSFLDLTA